MKNESKYWHIRVDTGGTFTDCIATGPQGEVYYRKVLSSSALRGRVEQRLDERTLQVRHFGPVPDDLTAGFRFLLSGADQAEPLQVASYDSARSSLTLTGPVGDQAVEGRAFEVQSHEPAPLLAARLMTGTPAGQELPPVRMRLATTLGTNTLLEHSGHPPALLVTSGFADLLDIGTQQRDDLFALHVERSIPLAGHRIEIDEQTDAVGRVQRVPDPGRLDEAVTQLLEEGVTSAVVALKNSYANNDNEQLLTGYLKQRGMRHVYGSAELAPHIKMLERTGNGVVNAYLAPVIDRYLDRISEGMGGRGSLHIMTSSGGLKTRRSYFAKDSLLSGPAAGVVGACRAAAESGYDRILTFDMGGTSTDTARFDRSYDYIDEYRVGPARLMSPALEIETVAAGGGSICSFDGYQLKVGPESAGADPGPACYGYGGPLTVTDVNALLGRLDPENFTIPVHYDRARECLDGLLDRMGKAGQAAVDTESVLESLVEIADERMAGAIRKISIRKGYDPGEYALVSFGGAGGQHACNVARKLGIDTVLLPERAGVLSAYGLGHAPVERFAETEVLQSLEQCGDQLPAILNELDRRAGELLAQEGVDSKRMIIRRRTAEMRYRGQESTLTVDLDADHNTAAGDVGPEALADRFTGHYQSTYGHRVEGRPVEVVSLRTIASTPDQPVPEAGPAQQTYKPEPARHRDIRLGGRWMQVPVYHRDTLQPGARIDGPALVLDAHSTALVQPRWRMELDVRRTAQLRLAEQPDEQLAEQPDEQPDEQVAEQPDEQPDTDAAGQSTTTQPEAAALELFSNRLQFMAEEMGEMLRRTALSVNVKERMDFSCALLDRGGRLVVNAPHIPVHLGALGTAVRTLMQRIDMQPGDVVVTNHPAFGGSHLPDVTVVTPVFDARGEHLGFAANRAHHAEIGGTWPGSMPPDASRLVQEGVVIEPCYLLKGGEPQWQAMRDLLLQAQWPSRAVDENLADLNAAIAANRKGAEALAGLAGTYGVDHVHHYMQRITENAQNWLARTVEALPDGLYKSVELLDDETRLQVAVHVRGDRILFDFTGTSGVHPGNLNATPAIVHSVIMYVLRLLIDQPVPLNDGLLDAVQVVMPPGVLNPRFSPDPGESPAVVGGNVETSQRLVDTLLKPFERVACSQGTMNNVLFGNKRFGYYETVCGGCGAGPDFDGADAVHHHMTNTRITDPEIMELRYPVRLQRFAIRRGSGGRGARRGGDGVIREIEFLEPLDLSVLAQHRRRGPYGLNGGEDGQPGRQHVVRADGTLQELAPADGCRVEPGDRFVLHTPGGGGFGSPEGQTGKRPETS